jgi:hypothetical protein
MTHPRQFVRDVYEQLSADQQAALALVYAAAIDGSLEPAVINIVVRVPACASIPGCAGQACYINSGSAVRRRRDTLRRPGREICAAAGSPLADPPAGGMGYFVQFRRPPGGIPGPSGSLLS